MDARIQLVSGDRDDLRLLYEWLGNERELRGSVRMVSAPISDDHLGSLPDAVAVALGAGGAGTVLASSLTTWLQSRRTSVKVKVEVPGRSLTLDIQTIDDARPLLRELLSRNDAD
jgi:membrane-associated two-gene conflict system component 1 (EACC1)